MSEIDLQKSMEGSLTELNVLLERLGKSVETIDRASEEMITALHDMEETRATAPRFAPAEAGPPQARITIADFGLVFLIMTAVAVIQGFAMTYFR